jgi:hypothetical protein
MLQPNRRTLIVRASRISLAVVWFLVLGLLYGESVVWGSAWLAPLTWFTTRRSAGRCAYPARIASA